MEMSNRFRLSPSRRKLPAANMIVSRFRFDTHRDFTWMVAVGGPVVTLGWNF